MSKLPLWDLFKRTVEGRPGPLSVAMEEGRLGIKDKPILKGAQPNARPLVDLLRSGAPIPPEVRAWLADLLDADAVTPLRLEFTHRTRGAPARDGTEHWPAAEMVERLIERGELRKNAVDDAAAHYRLSRSTVEAACASLKAAREEHRAACEEELVANDDEP